MAEKKRNANAMGPIVDAAKQAEERKTRATKASDVPEGMTTQETLDWVSGDAGRAEAAIKAEKKSDNPRQSLVSQLDRLASGQTGAGIASGEA